MADEETTSSKTTFKLVLAEEPAALLRYLVARHPEPVDRAEVFEEFGEHANVHFGNLLSLQFGYITGTGEGMVYGATQRGVNAVRGVTEGVNDQLTECEVCGKSGARPIRNGSLAYSLCPGCAEVSAGCWMAGQGETGDDGSDGYGVRKRVSVALRYAHDADSECTSCGGSPVVFPLEDGREWCTQCALDAFTDLLEAGTGGAA